MDMSMDKRCLEFLYAIYFGKYDDPYEAASNRAYRDMNRTIRFNGVGPEKRKELRDQVTKLLKDSICTVLSLADLDRKQYDKWHKNLCLRIVDCYKKESVAFTYGQAQKWVNMT